MNNESRKEPMVLFSIVLFIVFIPAKINDIFVVVVFFNLN